MGNFREHLKNGLAKLFLYTALRDAELIKGAIPKHLHITFDKMEWNDLGEDDTTKICQVIFDFGDIKCNYKLTFIKRMEGGNTNYILTRIE